MIPVHIIDTIVIKNDETYKWIHKKLVLRDLLATF